MVINYFGLGMIKLQSGETVVALNPISKDSKAKAPKFGADLALSSLDQEDFNGLAEMSYGDKIPFVIDGPGEYEVGGSFIHGLASAGPNGLINTVYSLTLDGINVVHLGALAKPELDPETVEELGFIDILFIPVGGPALAVKDAAKLAASLEPKVIIPLLLGGKGGDELLKQFIKEAGGKNGETLDKLTIRKKELDGKEGEVIILNPA